jgi:phosphate:Na+ symporter
MAMNESVAATCCFSATNINGNNYETVLHGGYLTDKIGNQITYGVDSSWTTIRGDYAAALAGTVLTAVVQSSSASVGILQALSSTGAISFSAAMPIVMGQNIGTCVTAMISALGANKNGRRAALVHLYFNIIGVAIWMSGYYLIGWILKSVNVFDLFDLANSNYVNMWTIAGIHTVFKLFSVAVLMPFTNLLVKLAEKSIKGSDDKGDAFTSMLDERLLDTPSVAIERSYAVAQRMAILSAEALQRAMGMLKVFDKNGVNEVEQIEDKVDLYNDTIASYLVKLSARSMSEHESQEVSKLLYMIGDFERICDHAMNIKESAVELEESEGAFSDTAIKELDVMCGAVKEIFEITARAFATGDIKEAFKVEPLEQVVDDLRDKIRLNHTRRLQNDQCTIEGGWILSDLLTDLERVSDHCSNIAGCLVEMSMHGGLELHTYAERVKKEDRNFEKTYQQYSEKYSIAD